MNAFMEFCSQQPLQGQRLGQFYMNCLASYNPTVYNLIVGTEYDCFYDDKKISNFIEYVYNNKV